MKEIKTRLLEHLEDAHSNGYQPVYLAVQGSQNYDLQYEHSDVDTKAIVLPSLNDIVLSKKQISTTHILENDEHCDVKDIRLIWTAFSYHRYLMLIILVQYQKEGSVQLEYCQYISVVHHYIHTTTRV